MYKIFFICLALISYFNGKTQVIESLYTYKSPNGNLELNIEKSENDLNLLIHYNGQKITAVLKNYSSELGNIESSIQDDSWTSLIGERTQIENIFRAINIPTKDIKRRNLTINCRLYDHAFAVQYIYNSSDFKNVIIDSDPLHWTFESNYKTWVTERSQGEYHETKINDFETLAERPLLIQGSSDNFYALGEAAVIKNPRSKFASSQNYENTLELKPEGNINLELAEYKSPWRFILLGNSPGEILEHNYLLENLNEENQIKDISWIKPGKVIREVTLTTKGGMACVDFAVENGLQYVEFDAGWYGNEYDNESDGTTITVDPNRSKGPLNLHKVIQYAKDRDIGVLLYVNNRVMRKQLDEILPLYRSWGIAGVKYGFVNTGPQDHNIWLHNAVVKAAENELIVDIHDDYRPTGFSRTYPNLLTQEGVRGDEESPNVQHSLYTTFIRGIAGAADNTICYQAPRVYDTMGGKGAQMAKSIMIYSPLQFLYWYDRPLESPRKKGGAGSSHSVLTPDIGYDFFADLPTTWDELKVLNDSMGEYGTIARRNGQNWYIGGLNANESRTINLEFDFLSDHLTYHAVQYYQDEEALKTNKIKKMVLVINKSSKVQIDLPANSGFALVLKRE